MTFLRDIYVSAAGRWKLAASRTLEVSGLRLADPTDQTKVATFAMASIATGTTRTYTFPNASGTLAVLGQPTVLAVAFLTREDPTAAAGNWVWTNMPAAATILYGASTHSYNRRLDLTYATQGRFAIDVAAGGVSGAKLYLRYSTNNVTFTDMTSLSCTFGTGTGDFVSGWQTLDSGAKADVWVQVWGSGGDGAADPRFFTISAEFR